MAIYEVEYKFSDVEGRKTNRLVLFDVADEAALLVAAGDMRNDLSSMSNCGIEEYAYRRRVIALDPPPVGSNIDPGATFTWESSLAVAPTTQVPDPIDGIKDGQGGIDLTDPLVDAYVQNYVAGDARVNRNNPTQPSSVRRATLDV